MALNDLGKVALTFGGNYSSAVVYERLTVVVGSDGQTYGTTVDNVIGIEPGVTENWQNYWQIVSMRGPKGVGIQNIAKTASVGGTDTYTIYYMDGTTWTYNVENGKGIQSIVLTSTVENIDTYTITFGNDQTQTFTVTNARELAAGGTPGQVLVKKSAENFDAEWQTITADNLSTQSSQLALSANQGYQLNRTKAEASAVSVVLPVLNWVAAGEKYSQTIAVNGVQSATNTNHIVVAPYSASFDAYGECGVRATEQGNGSVTFQAIDIPETDLTVNVLIVNTTGVTS